MAKKGRNQGVAVDNIGTAVKDSLPAQAEPEEPSTEELPEVSFGDVMAAARKRVKNLESGEKSEPGADFVRAKDRKTTARAVRPADEPAGSGPAVSRAKEVKRFKTFKTFQYVKLLLPHWGKGGRYAYIIYDKPARSVEEVTLFLYCHGMHSKDYHRVYAHEMRKAKKSTRGHTVFAGLVDMPAGRGNWKNRWEEFTSRMGSGSELIFAVFRELEAAVRAELPRVKRVRFMLAGHSGGHRVLDNVSRMLIEGKHPRDTAWLMSKMDRFAHFDVWYEERCLDYISKMLERWPQLSIYSTINHAEPVRTATRLAKKLSLKTAGNGWDGYNGRLKIRRGKSHWRCVSDYLVWMLEN